MKSIPLTGLLDTQVLQTLTEMHSRISGMPVEIIDASESSVFLASNRQDVCVHFHSANPISKERCIQSKCFVQKVSAEAEFQPISCPNRLWNIGIPIAVAGQHLSTLFLGPFFIEEERPDPAFFIRQANEFGYNPESYLAALERVPVYNKAKVDTILSGTRMLAQVLSDLAGQSLLKRGAEDALHRAHAELGQRIEGRTAELKKANEKLRREIVDRKKAEEELFKSREMLRTILDTIPQRVFWKDRNCVFIGCNMPLARDCGYDDPKEVIGKTDYDTTSASMAENYREDDRRVMETGKSKLNYEESQVREGGSIGWLTTSKVPLHDPNGRVIGILGTYEDITERKLAEAAIRESEANFSALAQNANDAILIAADDHSHEYANHRAETITGYAVTELLKMGYSRLIRPEDIKKEAFPPDKNGWVRIEHQQYETILVRKDQKRVPVEVSISKTIWKGKSAGLVFLRDITERKKMEERIKQDIEEKDVLIKEIHHRVKNNMQIISSLLNLQSQYVKDEKVRGLFKESQNRIRSMALIHERLYQSDNLARVDFGEYIRTLSHHLIRTYGIGADKILMDVRIQNLFLDVNTAIPCGLIVNELVSNALKYAFPAVKRATRISIKETNRIVVSVRKVRSKRIELSVSDNGIGLPKELDFHKSQTLGLRIVKALAGQMNGTMKAKKVKGTHFVISFEMIEEKHPGEI